jgi:hypothetical protein
MQGFKLNTTAIRNAKAKAKPYRLSAGRGLVLLVHPNGSKYWQYRYRRRGKEHLISIGVWGTTRDFVSLDEAFAAREGVYGLGRFTLRYYTKYILSINIR